VIEKPLKMVVYKTNIDGKPIFQSSRVNSKELLNNKVRPYYEKFKCSHRDMLDYGFQLTINGSLYLTYEDHLVPHTEYCVGYSQGIVSFNT